MNDAVEHILAFQWDDGNSEKNWIKHGISRQECEQVFFNQPFFVFDDQEHSQSEERFYSLGRTDEGKGLFVVYTYREACLIRIISARKMTKRERDYYNSGERRGSFHDD